MATMIKFRVWDKVQNKMLLPDNIEFIHGQAYWAEASADGQDECSNDGKVDGIGALFELEQFTGLKDVNGKDIYDGDIVSVFNEDGNYYNDVIEWCIKYNYPAFELKYHSHLYESNALSEIMNAGVENIKVIGNVYENPELLEADK
ncbi:YopX family protein [Lactiplantibacillus plantarum]|uniref:YopX family protein n=1 Tax=Lactiplantibacillus plantarum TaxID=1590 RepID=UPI001EE3092B|nr:YopX family protein [Lactiplantibacillus plantarum]